LQNRGARLPEYLLDLDLHVLDTFDRNPLVALMTFALLDFGLLSLGGSRPLADAK